MNLVVSGPIDTAFIGAVSAQVGGQRVVRLHARACRYEAVDASAHARASVADLCAVARVDHAFVEGKPGFESFGLLAMDMDSTLITIECIDEIADFVGKKHEVAAITEATMRGEIKDFAESLRRRVALLAGTNETVMKQVFDERLRLSDGAIELIAAGKAANLYTLLVSGGFTYFTERLVNSLGLNAGYANRLEVFGGRLTGRVAEPVFGSADKANAVSNALSTLNLPPSAAIVIGDGSNDIPMMKLVEHSIAYRAKPAVVQVARYAVRYGTLQTVVDYFN